MTTAFIALDWGTTSFRAYRVGADGHVQDTIAAPEGILAVKDGAFEAALEKHIGAWDVSIPVMAAGMITSRQGWIELPYLACPAGPAELARSLHRHVTKSGRTVWFSTGLSTRSPDGIPDVMRSEETQVFGSLELGRSLYVTPGTHSKWIRVEAGRIAGFSTYMTGEVFAALRTHTILGRLMADGADDDAAFRRGVEQALKDPAGFLHRIFSARTLALFNELPATAIASYLSGQVIGSEVAHAMLRYPQASEAVILASPGIGGRYGLALQVAGLRAIMGNPDSIVAGLHSIAEAAGLLT